MALYMNADEYINFVFIELVFKNMCFILHVYLVFSSFACLFVRFFIRSSFVGYFFGSAHNVSCVNKNVYEHYVVLFSFSHIRFNFWFDVEIRNHINIIENAHVFLSSVHRRRPTSILWSTYKFSRIFVVSLLFSSHFFSPLSHSAQAASFF